LAVVAVEVEHTTGVWQGAVVLDMFTQIRTYRSQEPLLYRLDPAAQEV
jgi:hypothetical protein